MIFISFGANLSSRFGEPQHTLQKAINVLEQNKISICTVSSIWQTKPVPISDQPWYQNAVFSLNSGPSPEKLMQLLLNIELSFGRVRKNKNEARVIDLDIIAYHDRILHTKHLSLPHPRMQERGFVLLPLQEISSEWVHPISLEPVYKLVDKLGDIQSECKILHKNIQKAA